MIFVFLFLVLLGYMTIGAMLSMHWAHESIKDAGDDWDPLQFLLRCCFKWPFMIADKDLR